MHHSNEFNFNIVIIDIFGYIRCIKNNVKKSHLIYRNNNDKINARMSFK